HTSLRVQVCVADASYSTRNCATRPQMTGYAVMHRRGGTKSRHVAKR
ncbi:MAG: hypothetical protein ACI8XD_001102, partial [Thermoproteota archaeon]